MLATASSRWSRFSWLALLAAAMASQWAAAQENIRLSLAGEQAAEMRRRAASTLGYYNVKLGPSAWRLGAGLGVQYDTNIRLQEDAKQDFILSPQLETHVIWPVSDQNSLTLDLSGGYSFYTRYTEFSRWFVNPGTELSFDVYVGDFWINLHDRFTITTDNYQDPTVVGVGDYSQLQNDIGVTTVWDLNKLVLRSGYDHINYITLTGDRGQPDASYEVFSLSGGHPFRPGAEIGLELGGGFLHYDVTGTNVLYTDATQWSVGPYISAQLTEHIKGRLSAGYTSYMPDASNVDDFSGIYAYLEISHQVNQYVAYALSGGRSVQFALFGGTIDLYTARLAANWSILNKITLTTGFTFEHGDYLTYYDEVFDRYGPSLTLSRGITKKLRGSLAFQYYSRNSNLVNRGYEAHVLSLNLNYQF